MKRYTYRGYRYTIKNESLTGYLYFVRVHDDIGVVNLGGFRTIHTARKKAEHYIRSIPTKQANPGRPPKAWWDRCMFSVSKTNADDPAAVCGAQWHHKMSAKQKRAAVRHERNPELIPGGLASGKKPSDFNQRALARGTRVELEHTTSKKIAREIAMDHLTEDPRYYEKLARMENPLSSIWGKYRRR